ncbi:MAG: hemerythrin domain-containing protein [Pseudomonadota bacterium]
MQITSLWNDSLRLGVTDIDDAHRAMFEALSSLAAIDDAGFGTAFSRFIDTVEKDFREEEALMETLNWDGLHPHRAQHARVLGVLHKADAHVQQGDLALGREAVTAMPGWFMSHLAADTALVRAMEGAIAAHSKVE